MRRWCSRAAATGAGGRSGGGRGTGGGRGGQSHLSVPLFISKTTFILNFSVVTKLQQSHPTSFRSEVENPAQGTEKDFSV